MYDVVLLNMSEVGSHSTYYLIPRTIMDFLDEQKFPTGSNVTIINLSPECIQCLLDSKGILHDADGSNYDLGIQATIGSFHNDLLIGLVTNYNFKMFDSALKTVRYGNENNITIVRECSALMY